MAEDDARPVRLGGQGGEHAIARPSSFVCRPDAARKAICAVAASILTVIYHVLKNGTFHRDLGAAYFDGR